MHGAGRLVRGSEGATLALCKRRDRAGLMQRAWQQGSASHEAGSEPPKAVSTDHTRGYLNIQVPFNGVITMLTKRIIYFNICGYRSDSNYYK